MTGLWWQGAHPFLVAFASESDTPWILLVAGPAGAVGLYWMLFRYYRNTDKSHSFETETRVESQPITGSDQKFDAVRGTKRTRINGDNVKGHRNRVQRLP